MIKKMMRMKIKQNTLNSIDKDKNKKEFVPQT